MIDHGIVQSTVKPEKLVVDTNSVWIADNISNFIDDQEEGQSQLIYQYNLKQYTKDEYIVEIDKRREEDKTQTDLALAEIAEMLIGG